MCTHCSAAQCTCQFQMKTKQNKKTLFIRTRFHYISKMLYIYWKKSKEEQPRACQFTSTFHGHVLRPQPRLPRLLPCLLPRPLTRPFSRPLPLPRPRIRPRPLPRPRTRPRPLPRPRPRPLPLPRPRTRPRPLSRPLPFPLPRPLPRPRPRRVAMRRSLGGMRW